MKELIFDALFTSLKTQGFSSADAHTIACTLIDTELFTNSSLLEYNEEARRTVINKMFNIARAVEFASASPLLR